MIERARELWRELPIRFDVGDAETLAFDDATSTRCTRSGWSNTLDRPASATGEMARVLRPGGRVLILDVVHDAVAFATEHRHVSEAIRRHGLAVPQPNAGLYLNEWLQSAGLEVRLFGFQRGVIVASRS
jgi:ubiquinone/menaquinone biosynthesis C-methylase UbiE